MPILEVLNTAEFALEEDLAILLENRFNEIRRAVIEFSYFLDIETKSAFWNAWHEYYRHPDHRNENYIPFWGQYMTNGLTSQQRLEKKKLVQTRIEKILKFTNFE